MGTSSYGQPNTKRERECCVISSIWLNKSDKFLLVCDGKEFFVYGDSRMANSIRRHTEQGTGAFAFFLKKAKEDPKDDFDPVAYWHESADFTFAEPPFDFSDEALKNAQDWLTEQKPNSTKI